MRFLSEDLVGKGFWALVDKGLFASSNFILNVVLASWLTQSEYGSFSVALAVFFLVAAFHTTLLSEPMLVFGAGKYKDQLLDYLGVIFWGHCAISACASVLILFCSVCLFYAGQTTLAITLSAMALASPCILLQWIMRRITYINATPHLAAYAGIVYLIVMLGGIAGLHFFYHLSSASALGVMAIASVLSVWWMIKPIPLKATLGKKTLFQSSFNDHRKYGRWATGTAFLRWIPSNFYYVFLPIWGGLEASAALRALMNLLVPFQNMTLAIGDVIVPTLVRVRQGKNFKALAIKALILAAFVSLLYWLGLTFFGEKVMEWLYSGKYSEHAGLLSLIGLSVIFATLASVFGMFLRAVNKPESIFRAYACAMIATVPFALVGIALWKLPGAASAITFGSLTTALAMAWFCWKQIWMSKDKENKAL